MALTPLTASQKSLLASARPAFDATDGQILTAASAFAALKADGVSFAALTAHVKATDWEYKPSKTRIYLLVTTYEANPLVTGKAFQAALKAATTANRDAGKADREAKAAEVTAEDRSPAGNADPVTVPVTVESILLDIARLSPTDKARLIATLADMAVPLTIAA